MEKVSTDSKRHRSKVKKSKHAPVTIISYAQNFEDVMLWRALSHVTDGFYIDIGAQDPIVDSVSLAFYEHGWRGLHVEPTTHYAELLKQNRPGEIVIQAAIGDAPGVLRFFEIPGTGISTANPSIAAQHRERGFNVRELVVPCLALSAIFDVADRAEIHWLKIDVEGFEQQVIESWSPSKTRPWIVVVESTLPLTQTETHENWEPMLIEYGYSAVYFDGLNRYYVSAARPELKAAFRTPPNIFDGFSLSGTATAPFHSLIEARYKQRIDEIATERDRQRLSKDEEIERLTESVTTLQKTASDLEREIEIQIHALRQDSLQNLAEQSRQHTEMSSTLNRQHSEQTGRSAQQLEQLVRMFGEREKQFPTRLRTVQQQHGYELDAQRSQHMELESTRTRERVERDRALLEELQLARNELLRSEQRGAEARDAALEERRQLRAETETLRRMLTDREREYDEQLALLTRTEARNRVLQALENSERQRAIRVETSLAKTHAETFDREMQLLKSGFNEALSTVNAEVQLLKKGSEAQKEKWMAIRGGHKEAISWLDASLALSEQELGSAALALGSRMRQNPTDLLLSNRPVGSFVGANGNEQSDISTLQELLSFHGRSFVSCAYRILLGRDPDPTGMQFYRERAHAGQSKMQILAEIALSDEGKLRRANIVGLEQALRIYRLSYIPVFGALITFAMNRTRGSRKRVMERALTEQIYQRFEDTRDRLEHVKLTVGSMRKFIQSKGSFESYLALPDKGDKLAATDQAANRGLPRSREQNFADIDVLADLSKCADAIQNQVKNLLSIDRDISKCVEGNLGYLNRISFGLHNLSVEVQGRENPSSQTESLNTAGGEELSSEQASSQPTAMISDNLEVIGQTRGGQRVYAQLIQVLRASSGVSS